MFTYLPEYPHLGTNQKRRRNGEVEGKKDRRERNGGGGGGEQENGERDQREGGRSERRLRGGGGGAVESGITEWEISERERERVGPERKREWEIKREGRREIRGRSGVSERKVRERERKRSVNVLHLGHRPFNWAHTRHEVRVVMSVR